MICEKCLAGQMMPYEKSFVREGNQAKITGAKCERCGYTKLENDDDLWSLVGL